MVHTLRFSDFYKSGIACAVAYCLPLLFFFNNEQSESLYILFISNFTFAVMLLISSVGLNKKMHFEMNTMVMFFTGVRLTFAGVVFALPFMIALFFLYGNVITQGGLEANTFAGIPLTLVLDCTFMNFIMGCISVLLAAFIARRFPKNKRGEDIT